MLGAMMLTSPRQVCAGAWLFGTLFGLVLLGWATQGADWAALGERIARTPVWVWPTTALAWLGAVLLRAWRLQREWAPLHAFAFGESLHLSVAHAAANAALPVRFREAGYVRLLNRHGGIPLGRAAGSLVWLRWQDLTAVLAIGGALLLPMSAAARAATAALVLLIGAIVLPQCARRLGSATAWPRRWHGAVVVQAHDPDGWIASVGAVLLRVGGAALLLPHLSGASGPAVLGTAAGLALSTLLPLQGTAGLGTFEAGAWAGAAIAGGDAAALAAAAATVHLLYGGLNVALILLTRQRPRPRAALRAG